MAHQQSPGDERRRLVPRGRSLVILGVWAAFWICILLLDPTLTVADGWPAGLVGLVFALIPQLILGFAVRRWWAFLLPLVVVAVWIPVAEADCGAVERAECVDLGGYATLGLFAVVYLLVAVGLGYGLRIAADHVYRARGHNAA